MGNNLYGNWNGHYSHGNQFPSADTVLSLCNSTAYCKLIMVIGYYVTLTENNICDFLRKSKTLSIGYRLTHRHRLSLILLDQLHVEHRSFSTH